MNRNAWRASACRVTSVFFLSDGCDGCFCLESIYICPVYALYNIIYIIYIIPLGIFSLESEPSGDL